MSTFSLLSSLNHKLNRGEVPSDVWARLVRAELDRCAVMVDDLPVLERDCACCLLDWYIGNVDGERFPDSWLLLYQSEYERELRTSAAILDWYCRRLSSLNHFERNVLIDIADDYLAETGEFRDAWKSIYEF